MMEIYFIAAVITVLYAQWLQLKPDMKIGTPEENTAKVVITFLLSLSFFALGTVHTFLYIL